MEMTVLLFGREADVAGRSSVALRIENAQPTCRDVREALGAAEPSLLPLLCRGRLAVNHEFVADDRVLTPDDEVALIGMVSGG